MLLSEGLAGFPSVAALSLGPMLLGLHPALPSGFFLCLQCLISFLMRSRTIICEIFGGAPFESDSHGSC
jgi:hypothetical protein